MPDNIPAPPDGSAVMDAPQSAPQAASAQGAIPPPPDGSAVVDNTPAAPDEQTDHSSVFNTDPVTGTKIADLGKGLLKGAGQTVNAISGLISHVAPSVVRPSDVAGVSQAERPVGPDQKIGLTAESIAEFLGGDEILKGLSVGAKYAKVGKLMDLLEESPRLRRAVNLGMQSLRQGTVAGVQSAAHGATPTEAAETAATGTVAGAGAGALTEAVGAGAGLVKQGAQRVLSAFTEPTSVDPDLAVNSLRNIQPKIHSGLRSVLGSIEKDAGIESKPGESGSQSIRDAVSDTADKFYGRAKQTYAELDAATGGHFQRFENALRDLQREANEFVSSPDEENLAKEAELSQRRANIEAAQDAAFDRAKAQGVDPKLIESARADFKKSQALYDLDFNVKKSISGGRPELFADPEAAAKNPEIVDPKKLDLRLNNMYDSGRLQEAVGTDKAKKLLRDASDRLMEHRDSVREAQQAAAARIASNARIRTGTKIAAAAAGVPVLTHIAPTVTHLFIPNQGIRPIE